MSLKLREEHKIQFDAIDFMGKVTINAICSYMQVVASNHAQMLGFDYYKNNGHPDRYWIISKAKYVMTSYPKWEEQLVVETYPGGYDKLYAVRCFDLYSQGGEKVGAIIGDYLLMDAEKQRPVRIKGAGGKLACLDFPYEGEKLCKLVPEGELIGEERRKARYYEIDLNEHMNNSHYIRWSADMLPLTLLRKYEIASLEINYNTSITYGMTVKLKLIKESETSYFVSGDSLDDKVNFFVTAIQMRPL